MLLYVSDYKRLSTTATLRDISVCLTDLCDQCRYDDPEERPSSVQLLEYLQQQRRREQNSSSLVYEALKKDSDSTFWDYACIERILESGADPTLVGDDAMKAIGLIADTSNKSAKDSESVFRLLLKYGSFPSIASDRHYIRIGWYDGFSLVADLLSLKYSKIQLLLITGVFSVVNFGIYTSKETNLKMLEERSDIVHPRDTPVTFSFNKCPGLSRWLNNMLTPTSPLLGIDMRNVAHDMNGNSVCWKCAILRTRVSL